MLNLVTPNNIKAVDNIVQLFCEHLKKQDVLSLPVFRNEITCTINTLKYQPIIVQMTDPKVLWVKCGNVCHTFTPSTIKNLNVKEFLN